ncbi:MAG: 5-methylcytosine-specific restriction endonuclease system specificity protein McrC [Oscillospiraceae bacterium]|nr:5-methylcytosine-specific restriction endonuclease system specificity protein McrC [Oscillospiraceae bacterium]
MILVKNIYYMLSYAFQVLKDQGIREVDIESFDNVQKLCAEILIKSVNIQIKRGLNRDYIPNNEALSSVRGKINVSDSIKTQTVIKRQLVCSYDEFSVDTKLNQIVKSTLELLLRSDIGLSQKKEIKKLLVYFEPVSVVSPYDIDWNYHYNRNNQSYQMIIAICNLVVKGLLQTQSDGSVRLSNYLDEQRMSRLYEKFILEYYRKHYPAMSASASQIPWQLDNEVGEMLPIMKSDITLQKNDDVLIIDAKYYSQNTQVQFDKNTIHSGNLYQIFTYVKNKEYELKDRNHTVSGMLLYAKTDAEIQPDGEYVMSGNKISVKTLDLNTEFVEIANSLDLIVKDHFDNVKKVS